jgi:hypothetical protein
VKWKLEKLPSFLSEKMSNKTLPPPSPIPTQPAPSLKATLRVLIRAYRGLVRRTAGEFGVPAHDLDCIEQAVFLVLWAWLKKKGSVEGGGTSPSAGATGPEPDGEGTGGRRGSGRGHGQAWLACAMVVLAAFWLLDTGLGRVGEAGELVAATRLATAIEPVQAVPALGREPAEPAAPPLAAPSQAPRAEPEPDPAAQAERKPVATGRELVSPAAAAPRRRHRSLETARILLDTAERMAAEGQQDAVDGALRAYAVHAPDDPLPATRAAVGGTRTQAQPGSTVR